MRPRHREHRRGPDGEARAVRRARADRQAVGDPRHEHLDASGGRAGDGDPAARSGVRHPLLQPGDAHALVEVVRPITASDDTIKTAMAFATTCGKDAIEVVDRAGFVVNALLFPYLNNAVRMFEQGTASMEDIDTAMCGGCNFPMGPFALLDLVGLDTSRRHPRRPLRRVPRPQLRAGPDAAAQGGGRPARTQVGRRLLPILRNARCAAPTMGDMLNGMQQPPRSAPVEPPTDPVAAAVATAADRDGIVGIGGDLEPGTLLAAYRRGLFPMPFGRRRLAWFSPDPRAIIPLDGLVVSRSLRRSLRRYDVRRDTAFADVMLRCADPRRPGSWITPAFVARLLHAAPARLGALVRVARREGALVGGLYGVRIGAFFAGEAMFHHARDASKVALVGLVDWLTATGGRLLDVQWPTPHLASLGAIRSSRDEYLRRLAEAVLRGRDANDAQHERDRAVDHAHVLGALHRRRRPTRCTGPTSPRARPACRSPSICRHRPATTPTRRWPGARSARSACRSAISGTCARCSTAFRRAQMNTSMTINATAPWLLALYVANAEEQGVDPAELRGTTQNDIVKEYLSRGTYILPASAVAAADRRHDRVVCGQRAAVEPDQRLLVPPAGGRRDAGTGAGLLARPPRSACSTPCATPVRSPTIASPGVRLDLVLRQRRHPLRRGDLQAARVRRALGAHRARALRRDRRRRRCASATASRSTASASPRRSRRTTCSASSSRCSP